MPTPPTEPAPSNSVPSLGIKRDWLDATVRLATSWVGLFTAYVVAITLGLTKYKAFTGDLEQAGLPPWSGLALIVAFPACALIFSTIPSIFEQRRIRRSEGLKVRAGAISRCAHVTQKKALNVPTRPIIRFCAGFKEAKSRFSISLARPVPVKALS